MRLKDVGLKDRGFKDVNFCLQSNLNLFYLHESLYPYHLENPDCLHASIL